MVVSTPAGQAERRVVTVGIAADDLTGANDSAVQFARIGWSTRLVLGELAGPEAGGATRSAEVGDPRRAVSLVTDARPMPPEDAREATASAVASLRSAGVDHLYLKIDSTMRGSIPAQVEGALRAWSQGRSGALAVVCPAYPPMGRTVEDGILLVDGVPVADTAIGTDPVTPLRTSAMAELVPGSTSVVGDPAGLGVETLVERIREAAGRPGDGGSDSPVRPGGVVVVDARTEQDLTVLARAVAALGPNAVPVGSAGLAVTMARTWGGTDERSTGSAQLPAAGAGTVLVVVSSLNSVSRGQADALVAGMADEDITVLAPGLTELTDPTSRPSAWLAEALPAGHELPPVVLLLSPVDRGATQDVAGQVAQSLAQVAHALLERDRVGALVLVGGDGARAVLDRIGATSIKVAGTVQEGIPVGRIEGGPAEGLSVVTKAGGFGPPDALAEVVSALVTS